MLTRETIERQIAAIEAERQHLISLARETEQRIVFANGQLAALRSVLAAIPEEIPDAPLPDSALPHDVVEPDERSAA